MGSNFIWGEIDMLMNVFHYGIKVIGRGDISFLFVKIKGGVSQITGIGEVLFCEILIDVKNILLRDFTQISSENIFRREKGHVPVF